MMNELLSEARLNALLICDHYLSRFDSNRRIFKKRVKYTLAYQKARPRYPVKAMELPQIDGADVTSERFLELSRNLTHPVLIRGFLRNAASTKSWSAAHFRKACAGDTYPTRVDTDDATQESEMVTMDAILDRIEDRSTKPYRVNLTRILYDHPRLIEELELHRLLTLTQDKEDDCFQMVNIFFGGIGSVTPFHCAFAGNFFNNIVGKKEWLIIDPEYTNDLLPLPAHPFMFSDVFFHANDSHDTESEPNIPYFRVVLEPGDLLYNAPWWWHRVRNMSEFTVGCAVRYLKFAADIKNNPLLTLMSESPKLTSRHYFLTLRQRLFGDRKLLRDFMLKGASQAVTLRSLLQGAVPAPDGAFEEAH